MGINSTALMPTHQVVKPGDGLVERIGGCLREGAKVHLVDHEFVPVVDLERLVGPKESRMGPSGWSSTLLTISFDQGSGLQFTPLLTTTSGIRHQLPGQRCHPPTSHRRWGTAHWR